MICAAAVGAVGAIAVVVAVSVRILVGHNRTSVVITTSDLTRRGDTPAEHTLPAEKPVGANRDSADCGGRRVLLFYQSLFDARDEVITESAARNAVDYVMIE